MRTWLKGAIIGFVVWIIFVLIKSSCPLYLTWPYPSPPQPAYCQFLDPMQISRFGGGDLISWTLVPLIYIIIGAIIGWIIGKIKNKK